MLANPSRRDGIVRVIGGQWLHHGRWMGWSSTWARQYYHLGVSNVFFGPLVVYHVT